MEYLIDQAHGIHLSGAHSEFRMCEQVTFFIYVLGEDTCRMEIGKNDIAIKGKEGFFNLVFLPCFGGNMEFHLKNYSREFEKKDADKYPCHLQEISPEEKNHGLPSQQ